VSHERLWQKHPNVEVSIDLLEGELDQEFEKDLEILSQIRQSLKDSDDVAVPESGHYYDALEARIMGALDQAIESGEVVDRAKNVPTELVASRAASGSRGRKVRRGMASRAGHFAVLAGLAMLMTGKWQIAIDGAAPWSRFGSRSSSTSSAEMLEATRSAAPAVLSETVMSFESDSDLALELAARENVARRLIAMNAASPTASSNSQLAD